MQTSGYAGLQFPPPTVACVTGTVGPGEGAGGVVGRTTGAGLVVGATVVTTTVVGVVGVVVVDEVDVEVDVDVDVLVLDAAVTETGPRPSCRAKGTVTAANAATPASA